MDSRHDPNDLFSEPPHLSQNHRDHSCDTDLQPPPVASFWSRASKLLLGRIGAENFQRWFAGADAVANDDGEVVLTLPNPIHHVFIEKNFSQALAEAVNEAAGGPRHLVFRVQEHDGRPDPAVALPAMSMSVRAGRAAGRPSAEDPLLPGIISEDSKPPRTFADAGLNPKFRFDNFVVGSNCQYSAAVAKAVAEKPCRIYNPLFFYGASGLGKTHLMQAIGREILLTKKKAVVRYVTSEQFTNEFVEAIKAQTVSQFRKKYRSVDVLLLDDVQFFIDKDSTQEEFFHTFNYLFNNSKQIVLASDHRSPAELKGLEQRLVSRFEWGLITQIQIPDYETRAAILRQKHADMEDGPDIEPWVFEFIAQRIRLNVRKLEGALVKVAAHVSITGTMPESEAVLEAMLHDIIDQDVTKAVSVDVIQRAVASHYDLRVSDLTGPRRPSHIALARQVAMYITRHLTKLPLMQIGAEFGGRDHGTVIHAAKVIGERMKKSDELRKTVEGLIAKVVEA